jgi:hypothetical protein
MIPMESFLFVNCFVLKIYDSDGIDLVCVICFMLKIYDSDGIDLVYVNCFVL